MLFLLTENNFFFTIGEGQERFLALFWLRNIFSKKLLHYWKRSEKLTSTILSCRHVFYKTFFDLSLMMFWPCLWFRVITNYMQLAIFSRLQRYILLMLKARKRPSTVLQGQYFFFFDGSSPGKKSGRPFSGEKNRGGSYREPISFLICPAGPTQIIDARSGYNSKHKNTQWNLVFCSKSHSQTRGRLNFAIWFGDFGPIDLKATYV